MLIENAPKPQPSKLPGMDHENSDNTAFLAHREYRYRQKREGIWVSTLLPQVDVFSVRI